jgi:hypothetical protein
MESPNINLCYFPHTKAIEFGVLTTKTMTLMLFFNDTALRSTQPLTEMSTTNLSGGKGRPARKTDLIAICELTV